MNQDTVYSVAVVNASAGATVTLPETDGRYMTAMIAQNDHYVDQVFKTAGEHVIKSDTYFLIRVYEPRLDEFDRYTLPAPVKIN